MDGTFSKELQCLLHGHVQYIVDALSLIFYLQRLPVVPFSAADLAWNVNVHFDLYDPSPLQASHRPPFTLKLNRPLAVSRSLASGVAANRVPDQIEHAGIGSRVGPGGTPYGGLIDGDDLIQLVHAIDAVVGPAMVPWPGSAFARDLYNISLTRSSFPEPDTPVTQVITPRGISTSTFFRLFLPGAPHLQPACGLPPL